MTDLKTIWQFELRRGSSQSPRDGACLLDAISWFEYGHLGDHPACVCETLAGPGRIINDLLPKGRRQELKPLIVKMIGTADDGLMYARAEFWAWQAIRVFAPLALESIGLRSEAASLRDFKGSLAEAAEAAARARAAWAAAAAAEWAEAAEAAARAARAAAAAAEWALGAARMAAEGMRVAAATEWVAQVRAEWAAAAARAVVARAVAAQAARAARAAAEAAGAVVARAAWAPPPRAAEWAAAGEVYDAAICALTAACEIRRKSEVVVTADRIAAANHSFAAQRTADETACS